MRERRFIPQIEWESLRAAVDAEEGDDFAALLTEASPKLARVSILDQFSGVVALDDVTRTLAAWSNDNVQATTLDGRDLPNSSAVATQQGDPSNLSEWAADWLRFAKFFFRLTIIESKNQKPKKKNNQ